MIRELTLDVEFVNSQLETADMVEFERQGKSLLIDHILSPYISNGIIDVSAMYREISLVNLEEIPFGEDIKPELEVDQLKMDQPAYIDISTHYNITIKCNLDQYEVIQHFIITNFPTYSYEDSRINPTKLPLRQPVSIIPRLLLRNIELDNSDPTIEKYLSCTGDSRIEVPQRIPINPHSLTIFVKEMIKLHLLRCDTDHTHLISSLNLTTSRKIEPQYSKEFRIDFL